MSYTLQFVDSITTVPNVRLSLNGGDWSLQADTTDFSPPPLRRAVVSTLLADGELIPAAAYANRVVTLKLFCTALTDDAAAAAVQRLARELDRPTNILMYQPGTSTPVYFRTLRADFTAIQWDPVAKFAVVHIPAEPFAYGPKETLSAVTVYNDPAEGTTLNANPYFETDASDWVTSGGTGVRSTVQAHQGVASLLVTPSGTAADVEATTSFVPVTAGSPVRMSAWVRCAVARDIHLLTVWSDGTTETGNAGTTVSVLANTWTLLDTSGTPPAGTVQARLAVAMHSTPPASNLLYIDEARLRKIGDVGACCFDITGVKGDVETPLILSMPAAAFAFAGQPTSLFAIRRSGNPALAPFVRQAESLTLGLQTTLQANDPAMSGSGSNFVRVNFTDSLMNGRVSGTVAASAGVDLRGTYRVFAAVRSTVGADVSMQLIWGPTWGLVRNDPVKVDITAGPYCYDLGLMQVPAGGDPVHDGYSGVELSVDPAAFTISAQRNSGTGTIDIDYVLFIPADDRLLLAKWPNAAGLPYIADAVVVDGAHEQIVMLWTSGGTRLANVLASQLSGGFPMVSPGVANRVYFVRAAGVTGSHDSDSVTGSTVITPSYYPRYLYVRPVST